MRELPDSDYKSDPEYTGREHNVLASDVIYESDTELLNKTASLTGGQQTYFLGAGEAIEDLNRFEQEISNLCHNLWAPFPDRQGFTIASWLLESKGAKSPINEYFLSSLGNSQFVGYSSIYVVTDAGYRSVLCFVLSIV